MDIELNFFELEHQTFEFKIFLSLFDKKLQYEDNRKFKLDGTQDVYEVSLIERDNFEEQVINSHRNRNLTLWYLTYCIKNNNIISFSHIDEFEKAKGKFFIDTEIYNEGNREIYIQPDYIKSIQKFGFVVGFHFRSNDNTIYSTLHQQKSFSLTMEKYPKSNIFINQNIRSFLSKNFNEKIKKLLNNINHNVVPQPLKINTKQLDDCFFSNNHVELKNNFDLIKNNQPMDISKQKNYYFIFRKTEREFAVKVYKTLTGDLYKSYFSGVKNFFNIDFHNHTKHLIIENFDKENIKLIEDKIIKIDQNAFLIFCMPNRNADYAEEFYINCKIMCLKNNVFSQFLYLDKLFDGDKLKFSASNIALQIFCKSGGVPWKVSNRKVNDNTLIIGIGTCHKGLEKFYSYAVCTDSSGIFNFTMSLSFALSKEEYLHQLKISLENLRNRFKNDPYHEIVFHLTTRMSYYEINFIQDTIKATFGSNVNLAIIKLNKSKKYIGFSLNRNDLIVKKGTFFLMNYDKTLIWTDGCYSNEKATHRPSRPLDVELLYSSRKLDISEYLDDIYKLSNANWHGFNSNTLPVSLVYAKDIVNFVSLLYLYDEDYNLNDLNLIHTNIPWFL